ncbi:hypothetical protein ACIO7M_13515 [Streptomyces toxytricini]|uniref:Uncharacterized protein n=1 Tax=Streptomyces toxytricini TaxID=67369 RepID=A0ABW8EFU5_STRT5
MAKPEPPRSRREEHAKRGPAPWRDFAQVLDDMVDLMEGRFTARQARGERDSRTRPASLAPR